MTAENVHTLPFVHLRVHSAYSLGIGLSSPRDLCAQAARYGYSSLALTDTDGTYGFVEFHRAAREFGIKPIYGADLTLAFEASEDGGAKTKYGLIVLALDRGGLKNLCTLASIAASQRLLGADLELTDIEGRSAGLICILRSAETAGKKQTGYRPDVRELMQHFKAGFGERVFVEVQGEGREWLSTAEELGIQPVLTDDVRFAGRKQYRLGTDQAGTSGEDDGDRYRLKSAAEMSPFYEAHREAYSNASMLASLVQPDLLEILDRPIYDSEARLPLEAGDTSRGKLEHAVNEAFDTMFPDSGGGEPGRRRRFREILDQELEAITDEDLAGTFLRFSEIVSRLRKVGVELGPATGLSHQSLCAYLLGITCFNPYVVDPHFVPDLDVETKGYRVLDLQVSGSDRPATVTALNNIFYDYGIGYVPAVDHVTPARALRMASQGLDIEKADHDEVRAIAAEHTGASLKELCDENRALGSLYKRSAQVRELIARAAAVEGLPCGFIRSKRTIIVSPRPLREFLGYTIHPETGELFYQATRDAFPTRSIYRIDIATLTALGIASEIEAYLKKPMAERDDWGKDLFDEPDVLGHINDGDLAGIYLLDTPVTGRLAVSFEIASFTDLTNFLSLMRYQHGGLSFNNRIESFKSTAAPAEASGSELSFLLNETRGWLLYDDQLREVLSALTGLTGPRAVVLLRKFRNNEPGNLASLRNEYMSHTVESELPMDEATYWFKRILFHVSKTLKRQRVISDSLIVGRLLWYKHCHRGAFLTALMNAYSSNDNKLHAFLGIAEAEGLLLSPHVNHSARYYSCENGLIRAPLSRIEGLSERAIRAIVRERLNGKFADSDDLMSRVNSELIENKEIELLVRERALERGREEIAAADPLPELKPPRPSKKGDKPQMELFGPPDPPSPDDQGPDLPEKS